MFEERMKIGLDIGAYSVKFVQLQQQPRGFAVLKLGYKEIAQTSLESKTPGPKENPVAWVLAELWREQKIRPGRVRLAISDTSIYLRHINVPRVTEDELIKAIKWQAEKYIPFPVDDAIVDFQTLGPDSKKGPDQTEVVVVAAKKQMIDNYLGILKLAKITPTVVDVCPFAAAKSFLKNYSVNNEEAVAIIDIGARVSSVIIVKSAALQFVRNIELAGNNFTQAIAQGLKVDINEAEQAKKEQTDVFSIIKPLWKELANEINRSFVYCETELLIEKIDKVILCGGSARFQGLNQSLAEDLKVPVEIGSPFKNIEAGHPNVDLEDLSPKLMVAVGVALE